MVTVDDRFYPDESAVYVPDISKALFTRVMGEYESPWLSQAGEFYDLIVAHRHYPGRWLAIGVVEHELGSNRDSVLGRNDTNSWTNARSVRDPSLTNWSIIVDPVRGSEYAKYASVADSLRDGMYRVTDPTYRYVREGRTSIGQVIAIWSEGDGPEYAATVARLVTAWQAEDTGETPMAGDDNRFEWRPDTSEFGYPQGTRGRSGKPIDLGIVHITVGTDSLAWLNGNNGSSAHYLTNRAMKPRAQMVREADAAWTAGHRDYNERGINVEAEKPGNEPWTAAQIKEFAKTTYPIWKRNNIPLVYLGRDNGPGKRGLIGHSDVPDPNEPGKWGGSTNHTDPGPSFDWDLYIAELRALDGTPPAQPDKRTFPETGASVVLGFKGFFERLEQAGVAYLVLGYPTQDERRVDGIPDVLSAQRFERGWLVYEPGNAAPWDVHLATLDQVKVLEAL